MNKNLKKIMAVFCVIAVIGSLCVCAFADGDVNTAITSTMDYFLSMIVDAFRVVGILIGVYAIAQFALAFKDDNPDQKQRGTIMLVIAIMLILIKSLAQKLLDIASASGITLDKGFLS